jgi:hypothetical protein
MTRWVGGQQGWEPEMGKTHRIPSKPLRDPFETPSKPLRNITGTSRVQHARSTPAGGWALAERAGAGRWGLGELAELKRLPKQAGVEGLAAARTAPERFGFPSAWVCFCALRAETARGPIKSLMRPLFCAAFGLRCSTAEICPPKLCPSIPFRERHDEN